MGKKKKNRFKKLSKKKMQNFLIENKVFVAALGGAAAGISLAAILGTDKAKQIVDSVSNSAREIGNSLNNKINEATDYIASKQNKKAGHLEKHPV